MENQEKKRYMFCAECQYFISKLATEHGEETGLAVEVIQELKELLSRAEAEFGKTEMELVRLITGKAINSGAMDLIKKCDQNRPVDFAIGVMAVVLSAVQDLELVEDEGPSLSIYGLAALEYFYNQKGATE